MAWFEHLHSANWNQISALGMGAYFLGCFTAGYYLVRLRTGQDIRDLGSGSVGARNVGRYLGRTGFFLTVLCDLGKGALAVWAAHHFTVDRQLIGLAVLAVVIGHIWPVQLRFRGGKGIATSLGALLIYEPHLALAVALVFAGGFAVLRRTVLPGLFAFSCLPLAALLLDQGPATILLVSLLAGVVLLAHRRNLLDEFVQLGRRFAPPKPDSSRS